MWPGRLKSQTPEVMEPEVLGLASLGPGALLLGLQAPLLDIRLCVRVAYLLRISYGYHSTWRSY